MDMFLNGIYRLLPQNGERLPIRKPSYTSNDCWRKSILLDSSDSIKLHKNAFCETVLVRSQAANSIRQSFRQHRQYSIRKINTITSSERFTVKGYTWFHIMRDISNMNSDSPSTVAAHHMDSVVKVARIVRIDREYRCGSQVLAPSQFFARYFERNRFRFFQYRVRKHHRKIIFSNNRQDIDPRLSSRAENLNNLAFGINVAVFPGFQPDNHFVVDLRRSRELTGLNGHINIVNQSRFIGHDVIKVLRPL